MGLRRAKHASMMVLYHLHNPNVQAFIHSCNNCQKTIEGEFYRCTESKCDFDLCKKCKETVKHPHKMELSGGHTPHQSTKQRQRSIHLHMQLLVHASGCTKSDCPSNNCRKMKNLLAHGRTCKLRAKGCGVCRRIWALLQIHARGCRAPYGKCKVPRCKDLKEHMRKARLREQNRRRTHYTSLIRNQATAPKPTAGAGASSSKESKTKGKEKTTSKGSTSSKKKADKNTKKRKR